MATATARIQPKKQTLDDAYAPPANFLEIDVTNAQTHGVGKKRYTDYEVRMKVLTLLFFLDTSPFIWLLNILSHEQWFKNNTPLQYMSIIHAHILICLMNSFEYFVEEYLLNSNHYSLYKGLIRAIVFLQGYNLSHKNLFLAKWWKTYLSLSDKYDTSYIYSQDVVWLISANIYSKTSLIRTGWDQLIWFELTGVRINRGSLFCKVDLGHQTNQHCYVLFNIIWCGLCARKISDYEQTINIFLKISRM